MGGTSASYGFLADYTKLKDLSYTFAKCWDSTNNFYFLLKVLAWFT